MSDGSGGEGNGLAGAIVLVTGAAQGIGECVARTLHRAGAVLNLADQQVDRVTDVAQQVDATPMHVDISDPSSARGMIDRVLSKHGRLDALVNVAGIDAPYALPLDVDDDHWRRLIDVDLSGPWWCTRAALDPMMQQGSGRIVSIASVCGAVPCRGVSVAYAAAKAGVVGMTMALAAEVEQFGILVNAIAPGATGTTGTPMTDDQLSSYRSKYPLGTGGPQPVADAVEYLLGDSGRWTSGSVLNVSGGYWHGR